MIERLRELQANKGQFSNGKELTDSLKTNQALRNEVKSLSKAFLHKEVSGCNNCFFDAYMELINLKIENIMTKQECQFELKRGKLLRDAVNLDISKNMTQANITDELALYHLKTNPSCEKFFSKLPEDWEKQVEDFVLDTTKKETSKEGAPKKEKAKKDTTKKETSKNEVEDETNPKPTEE
jgi:hypothetical protein